MARRSNKTAHVLNLLAGHDSQNTTEESGVNEESASPASAAKDTAARQPDKKTSAPTDEQPVNVNGTDMPDADHAGNTNAEPAPAITPAPAQNISVIDTTGEDPVAELIQKELSNQFEAQLAAAQPDAGAASDTAKQTETLSADEAVPETAPAPSETPAADTSDPALTTITEPEPAAEAKSEPVTETTDMPEPESIPTPKPAAEIKPEPVAETTAEPEPESVPTPEPAAEAKPEPVPETTAEPKPESIPTPEPTAKAKPEPVAETTAVPEPAPEPAAAPEPEPEPEPDFVYLNVMEEIVKDKIIYFMRQFDVCTCERCKADTIALTMNGLLPKYIVTTPAAVDPLVSYYTNRLISDVTVEATKACMTVKDNPRHD